MSNNTKLENGTKVIGFSAADGLKGMVVDSKESGFGFSWIEVKKEDGTTQWMRSIYLKVKESD